MPLPPIAETARIAIAERSGRERLQGMAHGEVAHRHRRIQVIGSGGIDQFTDQHRWLAHTAIAWIGTQVAQVEHLLRRGKQLQEQETVVFAGRAVAGSATRRVQVGS
ncbi:hypothetical protein G6F40_016363 [Rhizopus arrhizus]|nr:hypothetical protein G6F40_016363 [Rhizopus arrhizus]